MKKIFCMIVTVLMMLGSLTVPAFAEEGEYAFIIQSDNTSEKAVKKGDLITIQLVLKNETSQSKYLMYGFQDELIYNPKSLEYVPEGTMMKDGLKFNDIELTDGNRALYFNFVSMSRQDYYEPVTTLATFQMRVLTDTGVETIKNSNYLVINEDGSETRECGVTDFVFNLDSLCTVTFVTNTDEEIAPVQVARGSKISEPKGLKKDGYYLEGWYTDDKQVNRWDFNRDQVDTNVTLYANWKEGQDPNAWKNYLYLALVLILLLLLIYVYKKQHAKIKFETQGGNKVKCRSVKVGSFIKNLPIPLREGYEFAGWYIDPEYTKKWNFSNDKVDGDLTLYAKWMKRGAAES